MHKVSQLRYCGWLVTCLMAHSASIARADADSQLTSRTETLVVTGTRLQQDPIDQPYAFYRLDIREIDQRVGRMAIDRMNYGPGVFIQRTAPNQASPFIRGLTGEQTLLMLDGIRLSHAFMRPGPNQYAALVPDLGLASVDSILGSSSTVNGSDGLTGALDFRLAPAGRGISQGQSWWAQTRLDSGNGGTLEAGLDGAADKWTYSVAFGASDFHNRAGGKDFRQHLLKRPGNSYNAIPNTDYEQYGGSLRVAYQGFDHHLLKLNAGHKEQIDAPRPGGYAANSGRTERLYRFFDPQTFSYLHLQDQWQIDTGFMQRLDTKLWWHHFGEEQFRASLRDAGSATERVRRRQYDNTLDARGIDIQAISVWGAEQRHELTWGGTYIYERTNNQYREFRTPVGSTDLTMLAPYNPQDWDNNTTVSDDSKYQTMGLFVQDSWRVGERLSVLTGLRYSAYRWSFGAVDGDTDDITGSLRALWRLSPRQRLFAGISRGFRAPNLTNLNGIVDRGSSGNPATGNPNLDAEVSLTYEAGWKWHSGENHFSLTVFQTQIDDLIQRDFAATPAVTTNVEDAKLYGFESSWGWVVALSAQQRVTFNGAVSLLDATRDIPLAGGRTFTDNISRANRSFGYIGLGYQPHPNWSAEVQVRWHDAYDEVATHPSDADADDVRLTMAGNPDGSMPGYGVTDLILGWENDRRNRSIRLFIENLADKTYREPGSGVDGVGRNFGINASITF